MGNPKDPVKLRRRKTSAGLTSLYLDIYTDGRRRYEYLRLYLIPPKNQKDKDTNRATLQLAETIRAKRLLEIRNGQYGFEARVKTSTLFFPYFERLCQRHGRAVSGGTLGNYRSCLQHIKNYEKRPNFTFSDITPLWIRGFRDYLLNHAKIHSPNTCQIYFSKLVVCLNRAFKERVIASNPCIDIEPPKGEETTRMYLTMEELRCLASTPCSSDPVRRAFLFSCLTGLRWSDIVLLRWGDVFHQKKFTRIVFRQKKTKGQEYIDLAPQAVELLGHKGDPQDPVFSLPSPYSMNRTLQHWIRDSGIPKRITFHCARHTFAVMLMELGTDIYTVSKLLGHRNITTTQIYAKILDKQKQEAVLRIPPII